MHRATGDAAALGYTVVTISAFAARRNLRNARATSRPSASRFNITHQSVTSGP
jgi:hypothetical protein